MLLSKHDSKFKELMTLRNEKVFFASLLNQYSKHIEYSFFLRIKTHKCIIEDVHKIITA